MTDLKRCVWAVAVAALAAGGVFAQQTGGIQGGTGIQGGGQQGGGQQSGQGTTAAATAPTVGPSAGVSSTGVAQSSNIVSPYFANPSYQGVPSASSTGTTIVNPGGFGTALYGGTGTAAGGTGGRATAGRTTAGGLGGTTTGGARTGTTGGLGGTTGGLGGATTGLGTAGRTGGGATGGLGGTTGTLGGLGTTGGTRGTGGFGGATGGIGGANSTSQQLSTGRSIAYTQTLRFGVAPISTTQLQTDVQSLISGSSTLSGVSGLQATVNDSGQLVLKGKVADEEEARFVEGMFRLTPGVKDVKNELEFPPPPKP